MKASILAVPAVLALLASCSPTTGITVQQVALMNRQPDRTPSRLIFQMSVQEPRAGSKELAAERIVVGKGFRIADQRQFVYPAAYEPASAAAGSLSLVPSTPKDFQTVHTGIEADLTSERVGSMIVFKGTIKVTEFQGFSRMGGQFGQPIMDSNGRQITENRVEMPKLATFTTPVYTALAPDGSCTFEISHPKRGTSVKIAVAPGKP